MPRAKKPTVTTPPAAFDAPPRDDTMPGFDGDPTPPANVTSMARTRDEGVQGGFTPPPPTEAQPGYIRPPALEQFANATYLDAGPVIRKMVKHVLTFDEVRDLRGIDIATIWRRKGKPLLSGHTEDRKFAGAEVMDPLVLWLARDVEAKFPRLVLNLYWLHFDELRETEEGALYVAEQELERHVFMALLGVDVSEAGVLTTSGMTLEKWAHVVTHYGMATSGLVALAHQLALWPAPGEG